MNVKITDADKIRILNSDDLYGIMQRILLRENKIDRDREHFWVIGLAHSQRLLFVELISKGTVKSTLVEPMEVYSFALQKRASSIILCHNHPGGDLTPSEADKDIADRLLQVGKIVNTPVTDHLIISEKSFLSFADTGLMDILKQSKKYVPNYVRIQEIKKEAKEIGRKTGRAERDKEIAKTMKEKGIDIETISEITGLSVTQIKRIKVGEK